MPFPVHSSAWRCGLLLAVLLAGARTVMADESGAVYTDRESADEDYAFQGEYRGWQRA